MQHFIALVFLLSFNSAIAQSQYHYSRPEELADGWKTTDLISQNLDTAKIHELFSQLIGGEHKIHSTLLVRKGKIIVEEYFGDNSLDTPHDLRSTAKSIRSILVGIAIDKGYIESVDDPITKYLKHPIAKKNLDPRKDQITIRHLLTMSPGLDCNDWDPKSKGQEDKVYKKKDWIQYTLDLPMVNEPGTVSNYCSMGIVLLAEIISQASGMGIDIFAQKHLFDPLEIKNIFYGYTSNKGVITSGKRIHLTSRDMAKIGQLVLNGGDWDGTQIVSQGWLETSTTPKTKITGIDYGFLWWTLPFKVDEQTIEATTATGNGGQYILIFPDLDLVAVFTGGAYNSQEDKLPFAITSKVFLPTFMIDK